MPSYFNPPCPIPVSVFPTGKYDKELLIQLHSTLVRVRTEHADDVGICAAVDHLWDRTSGPSFFSEGMYVLKDVFKSWPKYSGYRSYPIASDKSCPMDTYDEAANRSKLWSIETRYGRLRYELLEFCIDKLATEIASTD
jgi:hypothetical protein